MSVRKIGDKYSLERQVGAGAMGAIWVALDPMLKRRVALKLMRPEQLASPALRNRFEREAMAIAQISNPHVVQVFDYGIDGGAPYIVMELLEGEDLDARLQRIPRLPFPALSKIITETAKGLGTAHAAGIVHRDLKPGNIFLARNELDELVKILDFGVAAVLNSEPPESLHATRTGALLGTPLYMSPEQARGARDLDHRSDLWSLGVVAYRALTGELPFTGESIGDLLIGICTDTAKAPSAIAPELSADVDAFFARALAKNPAHRFQTARELASAFDALGAVDHQRKPAKILVVDDEPDMALLIKQRFRKQTRKGDLEFVFANDGVSALEQLGRHPDVDLVLSDINMPGMDGLTLLGRVVEHHPLVKVVMVSAYGDMTNLRSAMNRGAFDFLIKPIDFGDLEITIDKTVKHVRTARTTVRSVEENAILRMFANPHFVERLLPRIRGVDMPPAEVVNGTVVVIRVPGFDAGAHGSLPDADVRRLNASLEVVLPEIAARKGIIDTFFGASVMALFHGESHEKRALDACLAIRRQLAFMADRAGDDSAYAQGIASGVASGEVILGAIGSRALSRFDFTALGEVVTVAARLASVSGRGEVSVVEPFRDAVGEEFHCEPSDGRTLTCRGELLAIYNVVARDSPEPEVPGTPTIVMESGARVSGGLGENTEAF